MTTEDFYKAGKLLSNCAWSDDELALAIEALDKVCRFLRGAGTPHILTSGLSTTLNSFRDFQEIRKRGH